MLSSCGHIAQYMPEKKGLLCPLVVNPFYYTLANRFIWLHIFSPSATFKQEFSYTYFPLVRHSNSSILTIFAYRYPEKFLSLYQFTIIWQLLLWPFGSLVSVLGPVLLLFPVGMRGMPVSWREKGQAVLGQGCGGNAAMSNAWPDNRSVKLGSCYTHTQAQQEQQDLRNRPHAHKHTRTNTDSAMKLSLGYWRTRLWHVCLLLGKEMSMLKFPAPALSTVKIKSCEALLSSSISK